MDCVLSEFGIQAEGESSRSVREWIDITTVADTHRVLCCIQTGERRIEPFAPTLMLWQREDKQ